MDDYAKSSLSQDGPLRIAGVFIGALYDENLALAYSLATPALRNELGAAWEAVLKGWRADICRLNRELASFAAGHRPLGVDRVLVIWVESGTKEELFLAEGETRPAFGLVMEYGTGDNQILVPQDDGESIENRWRVAGRPERNEAGVIQG